MRPPPGANPPSPPSRLGAAALTALGVLLLVGCAVVVAGVLIVSVGPRAFAVGLLVALVPVVLLLAVYRWLDRFEPEPAGWVLFAIGWGAAVATAGSLLLSLPPSIVVEAAGGDAALVSAVVVAPVVEETLKGLGIIVIILLSRRPLDGATDGFVYAGLVGIGFGFTENILYFGRAFVDGGGVGLFATFVLRGVVSPFAHPLFTAAVGVAIALASRRRRSVRPAIVLTGLAVAIAVHAAWNLAAVGSLRGFVLAFLLLQFPLFATYVAVALWTRAREGRIIGPSLTTYVGYGWLSHREAAMLGSLAERRLALDRAASAGGRARRSAVHRFQVVASRLAYLRHRIDRGTAPWNAQHREVELLRELAAVRAAYRRAGGYRLEEVT